MWNRASCNAGSRGRESGLGFILHKLGYEHGPFQRKQIIAILNFNRRGLTCHQTQVRQWIARERSDAEVKTVIAP